MCVQVLLVCDGVGFLLARPILDAVGQEAGLAGKLTFSLPFTGSSPTRDFT